MAKGPGLKCWELFWGDLKKKKKKKKDAIAKVWVQPLTRWAKSTQITGNLCLWKKGMEKERGETAGKEKEWELSQLFRHLDEGGPRSLCTHTRIHTHIQEEEEENENDKLPIAWFWTRVHALKLLSMGSVPQSGIHPGGSDLQETNFAWDWLMPAWGSFGAQLLFLPLFGPVCNV